MLVCVYMHIFTHYHTCTYVSRRIYAIFSGQLTDRFYSESKHKISVFRSEHWSYRGWYPAEKKLVFEPCCERDQLDTVASGLITPNRRAHTAFTKMSRKFERQKNICRPLPIIGSKILILRDDPECAPIVLFPNGAAIVKKWSIYTPYMQVEYNMFWLELTIDQWYGID